MAVSSKVNIVNEAIQAVGYKVENKVVAWWLNPAGGSWLNGRQAQNGASRRCSSAHAVVDIASGPPYNKTATEHSQPSFLFLGNRVVVYSGTSLYLIYY